MKFESRALGKWVGILAIAVLAPLANANLVNLVKNPGFELGDAHWDPKDNATASPQVPHTGSQSLAFLPKSDGLKGSASQTVVLDIATSYDIDFYLKGNIAGVTFSFDILDLDAFDDSEPLIDGWQHYVLQDFTGSTGGLLSFVFLATLADLSNPDHFGILYVDDVSINAIPGGNIPEPGSLLLVGAALAAGALVRRRTQQRF